MRKRKEQRGAGPVASNVSTTKLPEPPKSVYQLVPLPLGRTTCIRVIKIQPSTTSTSIACNFSIVDLGATKSSNEKKHSQPFGHHTSVRWIGTCIRKATCNRFMTRRRSDTIVHYQALCYTWGESPADHIIHLNGMPVNVRRNLWDFLFQARLNNVTGYIWIDAICIDQTTIGERNHQVAMMGDIYSRAECVIVWLGTCFITDSEALSERLDAYRHLDFESCEQICRKDPRVTKLLADELNYLPYWSRAWIVQEYFLARRKDIWYGGLHIDPDQLTFVVNLWDGVFDRPQDSPAGRLFRAQEWVDSWKAGRHDYKYDTLVHLFEIFQDLECADPRDRLYALMSLLSPEERVDLGTVPDYSQSVPTLFLHVFVRLTHELRKDQMIHSRDALHQLQRTLRPDLQDRAVQLAILELRARCDAYARNPIFDDVYDHRCGTNVKEYPKINAQGCSRCHKKPVFSCEWNRSTQFDESECFSPRDWIVWVRALLASEDEFDQELGRKIRNDRDLQRWDWKATGPYYGDIRPQR